MSRNFPAWEDTHWDFEKGNLDQDTKRYAVEAARRVKAKGGRIHFFALGQTFEQENVDWLREIIEQGHPVGNHTYDHVYVKATKPEEIQFRFKRAPWLIEGKTPAEVIADNIRMAGVAMKQRVGIEPAGFRTPGGFSNGISDRPDVQELLLKLGYRWVSSKYPAHPASPPGQTPSPEVIQGVVAAQAQAQPFVYPSGLIEVPMSPVSDINAFRTGRWPLEAFLETIRAGSRGRSRTGHVRLPGPSLVPRRRRPQVPHDRDDLRHGRESRPASDPDRPRDDCSTGQGKRDPLGPSHRSPSRSRWGKQIRDISAWSTLLAPWQTTWARPRSSRTGLTASWEPRT